MSTQKPIRLAERGIKKNSNTDDIVIDLFAGSDSTLLACEQMNRSCYTMDRKQINPKVLLRTGLQGGSRRPQTFRICGYCGKEFGPLNHLKLSFCSKSCGYSYRRGKPSSKLGKHYPHLQKARVGKCIVCDQEYRAVNDFKEHKQKFCSTKCYQGYWSKCVRPKMSNGGRASGELNKSWKGDRVGYHGLHKWIQKKLGKPKKCDFCGQTSKCRYEWSSIGHLYLRNTSSFIRLCTSCHRRWDRLWKSNIYLANLMKLAERYKYDAQVKDHNITTSLTSPRAGRRNKLIDRK